MGFVLNFITNANGIYSFIEGDFVVPTCFNTQVLATDKKLFFVLREFFVRDFFFVLNLSKQMDYYSF